METFLKKYLYFHRIVTYSIIKNNDIRNIFTLKAVLIKLFNETFLVLGISEYFFIGAPPRTPLKKCRTILDRCFLLPPGDHRRGGGHEF